MRIPVLLKRVSNWTPVLPSLILWLVSLGGNAPVLADAQILAPGYEALTFSAPLPGTYQLPVLGEAANGNVLDSLGHDQTLHSLMDGKITVLSFIYATCSDINGCPLATSVLHQIKTRLNKSPELAAQLRLLTLSFNPEYDTVEQMRHYGEAFQGQAVDWQFLTTRSERHLKPILDHYQQAIEKVYDDKGQFTGTFSHNLRVYLIDQNKQIRNIYSVAFLHPDTLINDIKTVLLSVASAQTPAAAIQDIDLLGFIQNPPLGLPAVPIPVDNPINADKINLGRKLFFDRRLSLNNTMSCAMCHVPEQGFTNNELATAVGMEGRTVRRNTPALFNVAYARRLFYDSREANLEQQIWGPLLARNEMANPSIGYVIEKINQASDYTGLFEHSFGAPAGMETLGKALASYERSLISANSAFDRWYFAKDQHAMDAAAVRGFNLFIGKAHCASCHNINERAALFTDDSLHNTGIGYQHSMSKAPASQAVQLAPGVFAQVPAEVIHAVAEDKPSDLGRYEITQDPADRWRYKTPGLRNVALTPPYMHNGSLATLRDVIQFYNLGGVANENLDPLIVPLQLSANEIDDLTAFLTALTGDNVNQLISNALSTPVGNTIKP
ncbi:MAG: cytochrome c peroxidase [Methylococcaceae bacterium]